MSRCRVTECGQRGCYVYQRARMALSHCVVSGTADATRGAVEAAGCRSGDGVELRLEHSQVEDNMGSGVKLRGAVRVSLLGQVRSQRNAGPDVAVLLDGASCGPTLCSSGGKGSSQSMALGAGTLHMEPGALPEPEAEIWRDTCRDAVAPDAPAAEVGQ